MCCPSTYFYMSLTYLLLCIFLKTESSDYNRIVAKQPKGKTVCLYVNMSVYQYNHLSVMILSVYTWLITHTGLSWLSTHSHDFICISACWLLRDLFFLLLMTFYIAHFFCIYMTHHTYLLIMTQHAFQWFYLHLCMLASLWSVFSWCWWLFYYIAYFFSLPKEEWKGTDP
jgi:hypothetical protein